MAIGHTAGWAVGGYGGKEGGAKAADVHRLIGCVAVGVPGDSEATKERQPDGAQEGEEKNMVEFD